MKESNYQLAAALRRELHAHPELSNEERWTKAHLMDFLRRHTTHIELIDQGAWFYGVYRAGTDRSGIAFRADFDAVPVEDRCGAAYASTVPGVSHACGHDGHSACLAALALEIDQEGADRNVYFLFQHAEETGDGARVCRELFRRERVDEIFGYHNRPGVPLGADQPVPLRPLGVLGVVLELVPVQHAEQVRDGHAPADVPEAPQADLTNGVNSDLPCEFPQFHFFCLGQHKVSHSFSCSRLFACR